MKNSAQALKPKKENQDKGYFFTVTDQEIIAHRGRSFKDIVSWLETTNKFVYAIQTEEERTKSHRAKTIENKVR